MKRTLLFLVGSLLIAPLASALPPRQHLAQGTIAAINDAEIVLALTSGGKDTPTTFTVKAGRTRLRENGKKSSLENLKVGQPVRIYYRKEMGVWVATEVSWKADYSTHIRKARAPAEEISRDFLGNNATTLLRLGPHVKLIIHYEILS